MDLESRRIVLCYENKGAVTDLFLLQCLICAFVFAYGCAHFHIPLTNTL